MCDAFLVLAQAPGGLSCFLLPRWRPDGSKTPADPAFEEQDGECRQRLKRNRIERGSGLDGGEEGRGVRTIIDMVAMTRFDCMMGSSSGMRMAVSQALHHCHYRSAFGHRLSEQPLMQNVLADLALESEAALALTMRLARALDEAHQPEAQAFMRLATALGKYWICKRTPGHAVEAMECIGGSGVMEDSIMPWLFRESPVNAIWEGSGNVQCLDMLRAMQKSPEVVAAYLHEVELAKGGHTLFDARLKQLQQALRDPEQMEYRARQMVDRMAVLLQASLLIRQGMPESQMHFVRDAWVNERVSTMEHSRAASIVRQLWRGICLVLAIAPGLLNRLRPGSK